jgi:hypothetical protein
MSWWFYPVLLGKWGISIHCELMLRKQVVVGLTGRAVSTWTQCSAKRDGVLLTGVWKATTTCSLQTLYSLQCLSRRFGGLETFHDRGVRACFSRTLRASIYFELPQDPVRRSSFLRMNCMKVMKLFVCYERQCSDYRHVFPSIVLFTAVMPPTVYLIWNNNTGNVRIT